MGVKNLIKLFTMDRFELYDCLEIELSKHYDYIDTNNQKKDYLYAKGDVPVMLVAHLDTVFEDDYNLSIYQSFASTSGRKYGRYTPMPHPSTKEIFYDRKQMVIWSPDGLGGDDRVGVYIILKLINEGFKPHILFTTDEEIGSKSSVAFSEEYKDNLKTEVDFIIQLDRQGHREAVFYDCYNLDFIEFIESFGFKENFGSFSDISNICPITGIAGVNLSVGYVDEHTQMERVYLRHTMFTFRTLIEILEKAQKERVFYPYIEQTDYKNIFNTQLLPQGATSVCTYCFREVSEYLYSPDEGKICIKCFEKHFK